MCFLLFRLLLRCYSVHVVVLQFLHILECVEHVVRMSTNATSAGKNKKCLYFKCELYSQYYSLIYRAINYDERDPFLCNSCGYSKYAKFETTVSGKSCAAVDPIESEEDRKKVCAL